MADVLVSKKHAGADSYGHVWEHDGDVVEMPYEQAQTLLAIRDAGFAIVDAPPAEPDSADGDNTSEDQHTELDAPAADDDTGQEPPAEITEAPRTSGRRGRPRKSIEE